MPPSLMAPHHGNVDLDGRPHDVGVFEGSTIILKLGAILREMCRILFISQVEVEGEANRFGWATDIFLLGGQPTFACQ